MTESKTSVPHFYLTIEINMVRALDVREQLNALASDAEKLSINDLIVAAAGRTLAKFPNMNASFRGETLEVHEHVNIGIAVAVEGGLLTPVLHDADKKSLKTIAVESKGLSERARANKMHPEDLGPGTFSVSNLGMFGIEEFAAIINPPEAAILAVGTVTKKPIVENDQVQIAPTMKVTLSVDHRVADGAQGARFLQEFKKLMENPVNLLV
jgi:pyruvate dehydrogenase E2 component (dihydrolipoamide acetyltransferase)